MKNLFHWLTTSLANNTNPPINKGCQNKHSDAVSTTFFTSGGDQVQTFESTDAGITFSMIKIHLNEPYFYLTDAAQVLHRFLSLLQNSFAIEYTTEAIYTFCKQDQQHVTTVYWQDATQADWKVLGWTNGQQMAVRYIKNINALPVEWESYFFKDVEAA